MPVIITPPTGSPGAKSATSVTALSDLLGRLDPDPFRRGKQFEHICKWFLKHDPVYSQELRDVWLWDEWPGRWGIDAGIDLVAEDDRGHLWAIQCKAYAAAESVTKRDVNKFLSESGRPQFAFRLLIATTNLVDPIARRTIEGQEKPASILDLAGLEAALVEMAHRPIRFACSATATETTAASSAPGDQQGGEGLRTGRPRTVDHGVWNRQDADRLIPQGKTES